MNIQKVLQKLHQELATAMLEEVVLARNEGMPVPAADKGAIAKFLKDNNITADPAANADLEALQAALKGQTTERSTKLQERIESISAEAVEALYTIQ